MHDAPPAQRYRFGDPDRDCRYPVYVDDLYAGLIFRWHKPWYAVPVGTDEETRRTGEKAKKAAAQFLVDQVDAGAITPQATAPEQAAPALYDPVPLLHPRMPANPTNQRTAEQVIERLADHFWKPLGGYPGADNPWLMRCELDGCEEDWQGVRYWSHLRGRNNNPPSPYRHPGCIGAEQVRARIAAYQQQ